MDYNYNLKSIGINTVLTTPNSLGPLLFKNVYFHGRLLSGLSIFYISIVDF